MLSCSVVALIPSLVLSEAAADFLRMGIRTGFAIILCNSNEHLETVRITAMYSSDCEHDRPRIFPHFGSNRREEERNAYRFNGIGGKRVTIH